VLLEYCSKCGTKVDDEAMQWGAVRVDADTYFCIDCAKSNGVQAPLRSSNSRTPAIPARSSNSKMAGVTMPPPRSSNTRTPAVTQPRSSNSRNPLPHGARTSRTHNEKSETHPPQSTSKVLLLLIMLVCAGAVAGGIALKYGNPFQSAVVQPKNDDALSPPEKSPVSPADTAVKVEPPKTDEDPREKIAAKYLQDAKLSFATDPKNIKGYREKLTDLVRLYGFSPAGKEAEKILQDPVIGLKNYDVLPPDDAWNDAIDLLAAINVKTDALRGMWSTKNKILTVSNIHKESSTLLVLPYIPPQEYDVRLQLMRKQGNDTFGMLLPRGKYGVTFMPGGYQNRITGFDRVQGKRLSDNDSAFKDKDLIRNNQKFTVVLQVRERSIKAYVDGKLVSTCDVEPNEVSISASDWTTPFLERLNVGSWQSLYEVHSLQVLEHSGKGQLLTSPDRNKELQKGLWTSYWKTDDKKQFGKMLMARPESDVSFDIQDSRIDTAVPPDNFSMRYAGVLRIDAPGKYQFHYSADDMVEVWIDEKSLGLAKYQATIKPEVELSAGDHPIRIEFTEITSKASLKMRWITPGDTVARSISLEHLWFDPTQTIQYQQP
jgi:hypothetical protein